MGLLKAGEPLSWEQTQERADFIRRHGIEQFINVYHRHLKSKRDCLRWGDEIEYTILKFDDEKKVVYANLKASELLPPLAKNNIHKSDWKPEYADYMLEGTPFFPFGAHLRDFAMVEENMTQRRRSIEALLGEGEAVVTLTAFPRIGLPNYTFPNVKPVPEESVSKSLFFPDRAIFPKHPRFQLLTKNIRNRRGRKIEINMPVFKDVNTESPFFVEDPEIYYDEEAKKAAKPDHVYMDAMGFGMGLSCLQVTFQAVDISEARYLYDQLANVCPIMMALSAGTPILRGALLGTDARWQVISASVDDRTLEEKGEEPLKKSRFCFQKSRYDSIDSYLCTCNSPFSDIEPFPVDQPILDRLNEAGIDCQIARHYAHLFCRDPLTAYEEQMNQDDDVDTDHFENIQSTNWQTLRFKPPPPQPTVASADSPVKHRIGWRVEFRPMEIQFTDFENAALTVFVVLLTRVILSFRLNLVIPLSRVDENLKRGHEADAIKKAKFWFRTNIFTTSSPPDSIDFCNEALNHSKCQLSAEEIRIANENCRMAELTMDEIFNGNNDFLGLVPLIKSYLDSIGCDLETRRKVSVYLDLIAGRASGHYKTDARWIRDFVLSHPDYKKDSRVSEGIQYDMLKRLVSLGRDRTVDSSLIPSAAYFKRQPSSGNMGFMRSSPVPNNIHSMTAPSTGATQTETLVSPNQQNYEKMTIGQSAKN